MYSKCHQINASKMKDFCARFIKKHTKTVGDRSEVDKMTSVALILQRAFGQQVLDPSWTWKKFSLHQTLNFLLFVYVFFGTLQCLGTSDDRDVIAEACYTLIMIGIFPLKVLLFMKNRFVFRKLYITAKTSLIDIIKADPASDIGKVLTTANRIVYTLFSLVLVPCSIYELTTLWNYMNGTRVLLSRSTTTLMPVTSPYYEIAWCLHTVFLFEISSTIILDMWFVLLIYFLCAASDSIKRILNVEQRRQNERKLAYASRLNRALKNFHIVHMKQVEYVLCGSACCLNIELFETLHNTFFARLRLLLLWCFEYLNSLGVMYRWLGFVPLCNAAMCTCLILLLLSKDINWRFAPHMLPMFAEIFAYNWFGEQIKTKAKDLKAALLNFDWTNLKQKDKKNYHIIVTYMNRNFGIKTVIGNDLSLITMTAVLKVTYQAFTVLQTLEK